MNSDFGDRSKVLETFISLKYFFKASICDSILTPKAIVFFGISLVWLVNEIKVIWLISPSLSKFSKKIGIFECFGFFPRIFLDFNSSSSSSSSSRIE